MSRSHDNGSAQVVTEAVLVSGVAPWAGHVIDVTLTFDGTNWLNVLTTLAIVA